jgi:glycerophosphoryl diester phosphodiesterase
MLNILIQPLVSHLRKRGILTFYWVCNQENEFTNAIKYGASGVMTDDPELLHQFLQK